MLKLDELEKCMKPTTRMLLFETPTNPLLKTISIKEVSKLKDECCPNALVVVDNTWATSYFQKPLELGADLSVVSGTKFYGGHSDCMAGFISTNRQELAEKMFSLRFFQGCILDPHSAWLMRRSMQTFTLRMKEHQTKVQVMARFLREMDEISEVFLPEVDGNQMTGYGCILFFELKPKYVNSVIKFMDSLTLFDRGTSMACVVSAVAQPFSGSHLSMKPEDKKRVGIRETLVRLCFGMEDEQDLKNDLLQAFRQLND
jgi:cystathionine gamma-lyase/cystathionine gamma-lyase/homocysteine desulfhydrase